MIVKPTLVDTDILSMYFRGHSKVTKNFNEYIDLYGKINISIITYYEIVSGLKHRDAKKYLDLFLSFANQNTVLNLTENSVTISAEIYANVRKEGQAIDDIDLLIAGIALSHNLEITTNNVVHFDKIKGLKVSNWSDR